jgi:hypothetical protein
VKSERSLHFRGLGARVVVIEGRDSLESTLKSLKADFGPYDNRDDSSSVTEHSFTARSNDPPDAELTVTELPNSFTNGIFGVEQFLSNGLGAVDVIFTDLLYALVFPLTQGPERACHGHSGDIDA